MASAASSSSGSAGRSGASADLMFDMNTIVTPVTGPLLDNWVGSRQGDVIHLRKYALWWSADAIQPSARTYASINLNSTEHRHQLLLLAHMAANGYRTRRLKSGRHDRVTFLIVPEFAGTGGKYIGSMVLMFENDPPAGQPFANPADGAHVNVKDKMAAVRQRQGLNFGEWSARLMELGPRGMLELQKDGDALPLNSPSARREAASIAQDARDNSKMEILIALNGGNEVYETGLWGILDRETLQQDLLAAATWYTDDKYRLFSTRYVDSVQLFTSPDSGMNPEVLYSIENALERRRLAGIRAMDGAEELESEVYWSWENYLLWYKTIRRHARFDERLRQFVRFVDGVEQREDALSRELGLCRPLFIQRTSYIVPSHQLGFRDFARRMMHHLVADVDTTAPEFKDFVAQRRRIERTRRPLAGAGRASAAAAAADGDADAMEADDMVLSQQSLRPNNNNANGHDLKLTTEEERHYAREFRNVTQNATAVATSWFQFNDTTRPKLEPLLYDPARRAEFETVRLQYLSRLRTLLSPDRYASDDTLMPYAQFYSELRRDHRSICGRSNLGAPTRSLFHTMLDDLMNLIDIGLQCASQHRVLIHSIAMILIDSSRKLEKEDLRSTLILHGPPSASKSAIFGWLKRMGIPGVVQMLMSSTARAYTDGRERPVWCDMRDDTGLDMLGFDTKTVTKESIRARVLSLDMPAETPAYIQFKTLTTNESTATAEFKRTAIGANRSTGTSDGRSSRTLAMNMNQSVLYTPKVVQARIMAIAISSTTDPDADIANRKMRQEAMTAETAAISAPLVRAIQDLSWNGFHTNSVIYNRMKGRCDTVIPISAYNILSSAMVRRGMTEAREGRSISKFIAIAMAYTMMETHKTVFDCGIGGPDPSKPWEDADSFLMEPYLTCSYSTAFFCLTIESVFGFGMVDRVFAALARFVKLVTRDIGGVRRAYCRAGESDPSSSSAAAVAPAPATATQFGTALHRNNSLAADSAAAASAAASGRSTRGLAQLKRMARLRRESGAIERLAATSDEKGNARVRDSLKSNERDCFAMTEDGYLWCQSFFSGIDRRGNGSIQETSELENMMTLAGVLHNTFMTDEKMDENHVLSALYYIIQNRPVPQTTHVMSDSNACIKIVGTDLFLHADAIRYWGGDYVVRTIQDVYYKLDQRHEFLTWKHHRSVDRETGKERVHYNKFGRAMAGLGYTSVRDQEARDHIYSSDDEDEDHKDKAPSEWSLPVQNPLPSNRREDTLPLGGTDADRHAHQREMRRARQEEYRHRRELRSRLHRVPVDTRVANSTYGDPEILQHLEQSGLINRQMCGRFTREKMLDHIPSEEDTQFQRLTTILALPRRVAANHAHLSTHNARVLRAHFEMSESMRRFARLWTALRLQHDPSSHVYSSDVVRTNMKASDGSAIVLQRSLSTVPSVHNSISADDVSAISTRALSLHDVIEAAIEMCDCYARRLVIGYLHHSLTKSFLSVGGVKQWLADHNALILDAAPPLRIDPDQRAMDFKQQPSEVASLLYSYTLETLRLAKAHRSILRKQREERRRSSALSAFAEQMEDADSDSIDKDDALGVADAATIEGIADRRQEAFANLITAIEDALQRIPQEEYRRRGRPYVYNGVNRSAYDQMLCNVEPITCRHWAWPISASDLTELVRWKDRPDWRLVHRKPHAAYQQWDILRWCPNRAAAAAEEDDKDDPIVAVASSSRPPPPPPPPPPPAQPRSIPLANGNADHKHTAPPASTTKRGPPNVFATSTRPATDFAQFNARISIPVPVPPVPLPKAKPKAPAPAPASAPAAAQNVRALWNDLNGPALPQVRPPAPTPVLAPAPVVAPVPVPVPVQHNDQGQEEEYDNAFMDAMLNDQDNGDALTAFEEMKAQATGEKKQQPQPVPVPTPAPKPKPNAVEVVGSKRKRHRKPKKKTSKFVDLAAAESDDEHGEKQVDDADTDGESESDVDATGNVEGLLTASSQEDGGGGDSQSSESRREEEEDRARRQAASVVEAEDAKEGRLLTGFARHLSNAMDTGGGGASDAERSRGSEGANASSTSAMLPSTPSREDKEEEIVPATPDALDRLAEERRRRKRLRRAILSDEPDAEPASASASADANAATQIVPMSTSSLEH